MMPQEGAEAPAPAKESEDQIVDQIGMLIQQLSPEKQQMVVAKLAEMMGAGSEPVSADEGMTDANAGANGVPMERT